MPSSQSQSSKSGPVAVIAVHGVADQDRDQTAVRAANLLLHLGQVEREGCPGADPKPGYTGFEQEKIRLGLDPLDVSGMGEDNAWQYQLRRHLEKYQGDGTNSYETVRMEGYRMIKDGADEEPKIDRPVHIYELYWADASRLPIGILNLFLGIYRLLFQTSWLGIQTIGCWASFAPDVGRWSNITSFRGIMLLLNRVCSLILTRFMPMLYLLMIGLLVLMVIPIVESSWAQGLLGGLGGYPGLFALDVVVVVAGLLIVASAKVWRRVPWPPLYGVVAVVSYLAWNLAFAAFQDQTGSWRAEVGVALATWGVICLVVFLFVLPGLGKRFPGSGIVGVVLMGYFTAALILGLTRETTWPLLITGPMLALRMGFALLPFAWMILASTANLFLILAALESIGLWFRRGLAPEVVRRKRARLRTAAISIILPVLLISFLNSTFFLLALVPFKMGLVDGAAPVAERMADAPAWVKPLNEAIVQAYVEPFARKWASMPEFRDWAANQAAGDARFSAFANYASRQMVVPFLEAVFLVVLLVLGYSLWVVAPAVVAEGAFRRVGKGRQSERMALALGDNLTQGYNWLWSGQVLLAGCLIATQLMFAYRGIRTGQLAKDPNAHQAPMMLLVDQFLGIKHLGQTSAPVAVAVAEAVNGAPAVAGAVPGTPVADVTALAGSPAPAGAASAAGRPVVRTFGPPGQGRAQFPAPGRSLRSPFSHRMPVPQHSYEQRQEVREAIEDIFKRREDADKSRPAPLRATPPGKPGAAPSSKEAPPSLLVKTLTETVLFLNTGPLTSALGASILILALGYFFFARLMDPVVSGLRGGLDIALDVLNYLRPRPVEETPRARILSRYASLLRFVTSWRDPQNPHQGYSRIVILAHSQGTVITSDILRALAVGSVASDNDLSAIRPSLDSKDGIPVRVFTMGSPLRQLYAARFPDLYSWDPAEDPRRSHRGVECWWNVYRSGDYVGRALFRGERDKERWIPGRDYFQTEEGKNLPVRESCLGPGAHIHYWDESAPEVIRDLDRLIASDDLESLCRPCLEKKTSAT